MYQQLSKIALKFMKQSTMFRVGFNLSPMYRRSTARIITVSDDLHKVTIRIPLSYKNKNYVGSIFGGSLFASVDPIPMIQLMYILNDNYIIWDKSAEIKFKRPARETVYANFEFSKEEIQEIIQKVKDNNEIEHLKTTLITNKSGDTVYCEVAKSIYIANKEYFKNKRKIKEKL